MIESRTCTGGLPRAEAQLQKLCTSAVLCKRDSCPQGHHTSLLTQFRSSAFTLRTHLIRPGFWSPTCTGSPSGSAGSCTQIGLSANVKCMLNFAHLQHCQSSLSKVWGSCNTNG